MPKPAMRKRMIDEKDNVEQENENGAVACQHTIQLGD